MKIVHLCLTSIFDSAYAYQENLLSKYHRKAGHEVTVIATVNQKYDARTGKIIKSSCREELTADDVRVLRLRLRLPALLDARFHWVKGLRKALEKENPDLIFVHGLSSVSYLSLRPFVRRHPQVKVVFDNHGDRLNSCRNLLSLLYTKFIYRLAVCRTLEKIGLRFYGVTPGRCAFLHDIYGISKEKIDLLLMGADDEALETEKRDFWRESIRTIYDIAADDFLLVSGGKIDLQKNIHLLAEAVNVSTEKHLKLLCFGSLNEEVKTRMEAQLSDKVKVVGWVPSDEVYRYFYAADLVVFPGLHSVLWEQALAAKVPCAFSRLEGFDQVDVPGVLLFAESSVSAYRACVEKISKDMAAYSTLKKDAYTVEREKFLYSRIAQKVIDDVF